MNMFGFTGGGAATKTVLYTEKTLREVQRDPEYRNLEVSFFPVSDTFFGGSMRSRFVDSLLDYQDRTNRDWLSDLLEGDAAV